MTDDLTAEQRLKKALGTGMACVLTAGSDVDKLENKAQWGPERTLDADVVRKALLDTASVAVAAMSPLVIIGARIVGALNLNGTTVTRPLFFHGCDIAAAIDLTDARSSTLGLFDSHVDQLRAHRVIVDGSLLIRSCEIARVVGLRAAHIKGDLDLNRTHMGPDAPLQADRIRVDGAVFLGSGFNNEAGVALDSARVGSELGCSGGMFSSTKGPAFSIRGSEIGNACLFDGATIQRNDGVALAAEAFRVKEHATFFLASVEGRVTLRGSQIGGNLRLDGATIARPGGIALDLERARIGGDLLLKPGERVAPQVPGNPMPKSAGEPIQCPTEIVGGLALTSLSVIGTVMITGAKLRNERGESILMNRLNAGGMLVLADTETGTGRFSLANAKAGGLVDDERSWPKGGHLILNGFEYGTISGDSATDWQSRLQWLKLQIPSDLREDFRPQPFTQLASVLRRMGHERDARMISIGQQRSLRRASTPGSWRWIWNVVLEFTCGHGYRPWIAALWVAFFIMVGYGVFADARDAFVPTKDAAATQYRGWGKTLPDGYPPFQPLVYSADVLLPIVNLQQKEYWTPDVSKPGGHAAWAYRPFHILAGWFFTTLFVAGVTGLIRRN